MVGADNKVSNWLSKFRSRPVREDGKRCQSVELSPLWGAVVAVDGAASSPVTTAERGTHLTLQGAPDALKTRAHPRLAIPEHSPLPHISWVGLKVQGPGDAAT
jgi:hypothetical protein